MDDDMRLVTCFMDGVAKGAITVLICLAFVVVLLWAMFAAPEEKYKMVCEPAAIIQGVD